MNTGKNPFLEYRSDGLRVGELSRQMWCEKKVDLELRYGQKETLKMKKGKRRHEELLEEIITIIPVQPETFADYLFVRLQQMLLMAQKIMERGLGRELPVFGKIGTMIVKGYIDELVIKDGKLEIVEEKTTARGKLPSNWGCRVVEFQLSLYKLMIDNIKEGHYTDSDLIAFYDIKPETSISETFFNSLPRRNVLVTTNVSRMASMAFSAVRSLPETADTLVARYENQSREFIGEKKFVFDEKKLRRNIDSVLGYWKGSRDANPVSPEERLKCDSCHRDLRNKCDVHSGMQWNMGKEQIGAREELQNLIKELGLECGGIPSTNFSNLEFRDEVENLLRNAASDSLDKLDYLFHFFRHPDTNSILRDSFIQCSGDIPLKNELIQSLENTNASISEIVRIFSKYDLIEVDYSAIGEGSRKRRRNDKRFYRKVRDKFGITRVREKKSFEVVRDEIGLDTLRKIVLDKRKTNQEKRKEIEEMSRVSVKPDTISRWKGYFNRKEIHGKKLYLDIESTGIDLDSDDITVVGIFDGESFCQLIRGIDLCMESLESRLANVEQIITFFGNHFDIPFVDRKFPNLNIKQIDSFDLQHKAWILGFLGGLKEVEKRLGIKRRTGYMSGIDAIRCWRDYRKGSKIALRELLEYNKEDVLNLVLLEKEISKILYGGDLE